MSWPRPSVISAAASCLGVASVARRSTCDQGTRKSVAWAPILVASTQKQTRGVASIKLAALLNKPDRRKTHVELDYKGFDIPDRFVVGYGLDYDERYRNLPYIGVLKS